MAADWQPLLWASKDNNLQATEVLLSPSRRGGPLQINEQEPEKSSSNKYASAPAPFGSLPAERPRHLPPDRYTALHWAAVRGHRQMAELLMANGADHRLKDKHGNTPKTLAEKKGNKAITDILPEK